MLNFSGFLPLTNTGAVGATTTKLLIDEQRALKDKAAVTERLASTAKRLEPQQ